MWTIPMIVLRRHIRDSDRLRRFLVVPDGTHMTTKSKIQSFFINMIFANVVMVLVYVSPMQFHQLIPGGRAVHLLSPVDNLLVPCISGTIASLTSLAQPVDGMLTSIAHVVAT